MSSAALDPPAGRASRSGVRRPAARTVALAIAVAAGVVAATGLVLMAVNAGTALPDGSDWRVANVGALGFLACGALLTVRQPASGLSWVALAVGATLAVALATSEYAVLALVTAPDDGLPAGRWAQWLSQWVWMPGYLLLVTLLVLLFPDGRLPGPRWRAVLPLTAVLVFASTVRFAVTPWEDLGEPVVAPHVANPVSAPAVADALTPLLLLAIPCVGLAAWSVIVRVRRADGAERRQLRWFGGGVAVAAVLLAAGQLDHDVAPYALALALLVLPAAVTAAVLRHGRWLGERLVGDLRASRERLVSAREEERRRLRADLHDEVGPSLAVLALRLDAAAEGNPAEGELRALAAHTRDTLAQVRRIVHDLRPAALADLGLEAALGAAVAQLDGAGLRARLDVRGGPLGALPAAVEVAAYRIVREALANAARHAGAHAVEVTVERRSGVLLLSVEDDGAGLPPDGARGRGLGLASMAERADELGGRLTVGPRAAGGGTSVAAELPA